MLETVGQFGLQYSEQAHGTLGSLVATPSLLSRVIVSHPDSHSDPIGESESGSEARDRTGTLYLIFFFQSRICTCGYGPHLIIESKYHIHIKRTTTGVVSIKIYKHLSSLIYKHKTILLHLQIRARNLHVVNPYKCVGPAVCGCFQTSSPVPTRIKNPC